MYKEIDTNYLTKKFVFDVKKLFLKNILSFIYNIKYNTSH